MAYFVNGQSVPEELIGQAAQWLARDPRWQSIPDLAERASQLRAAAEQAAIERMLIEQRAFRDPRPMPAHAIDQEIQRRKVQIPGRPTVFDDPQVRRLVEHELRVQRTIRKMVAEAAKPSEKEMKAFYNAQRENFRAPARFRAAHIVRL